MENVLRAEKFKADNNLMSRLIHEPDVADAPVASAMTTVPPGKQSVPCPLCAFLREKGAWNIKDVPDHSPSGCWAAKRLVWLGTPSEGGATPFAAKGLDTLYN